ncbi:hypothetical protein Huta_2617 [Halorhabdus utahensis DSM 12940]|uniref:Uncharacterized protein n=1 Tax=Halorhabdus utahensis (strain DSM 12940 / JCM 11049 / AX-2) TaxID=519442 RepID=C7NPM4_HALUD|nr:hypothetical protein Huta_2617 [Halorhabdus utahensis DSM 12940]
MNRQLVMYWLPGAFPGDCCWTNTLIEADLMEDEDVRRA